MTEIITAVNEKINAVVWGTPMLLLLLGTGVFLSIRLRFFQITKFKLWFKETALSLFRKDTVTVKNGGEKSISQLQAVSTALAAALGTGNIAGVATALAAGGAGAIFWMWISAIFGMITGFAENTLGIMYRTKSGGGAMYYLRDGVGSLRGMKKLGGFLAVIFALFCTLASFGIGNMTQVNSIADALRSEFSVPPIATGLILAVISALVLVGGIKRIGKVAEKIVPAMAILYIVVCIAVLAVNFTNIPRVFSDIFSCAFGFRQAAGGVSGYWIKNAVSVGFRRGVFSNEAGLGSSVAVNASSDVTEPIKQGMWSVFEIFFDTIVMCTLTAVAVLSASGEPITLEQALNNISEQPQLVSICEKQPLISAEPVPLLRLADNSAPVGSYTEISARTASGKYFTIKLDKTASDSYNFVNLVEIRGIAAKNSDGSAVLDENGEVVIGAVELNTVNGASLVAYVFGQCFGSAAGKLLAIMVLLFAFSTVLGWSFNGAGAAEYLFGSRCIPLYRAIFVVFIVIGATVSLNLAWDISDTLNGLMAVPNLIGVLLLSGRVRGALSDYLHKNSTKRTRKYASDTTMAKKYRQK